MIKTISILGCGWLGLPLARKLISLGYTVKGSTTSQDKTALLKNSNIIPYQLNCTSGSIEGDHVADFFKTDALFVNIPFKRNLQDPQVYPAQMKVIARYAVEGGVRKVVFASSTAVYPVNNRTAREDDIIVPSDKRAEALLSAEGIFLSEQGFNPIVIRFAGLYGPDREIAGFLKSGRVTSKDGNTPVNLIHLDDCLGIVTIALEKDISGEIFNACGDAHPLRKDLYVHAAIAMGIKPPAFAECENPSYKIVSNEKVKLLLSYRFIHPGPWDWISQNMKSDTHDKGRPV